MIKQVLHNIFSVSLATLVLLSTMSFTIDKHFCGDVLVDSAVFVEAKKCAMEAYEIEQALITKKYCCKDELEVVKGQDKLKRTSFEDLKFDQQVVVTTFAYNYNLFFESLPKQVIPHKDYSPPNLVIDIHVLDQVFII
ncbi:hypothetical protein OE09_0660 [Flavobacteriaceae bacterium MAR_2010_72]|nr:hypothetical protein OE09_0660 [Flavobacteriaceae bacterium MAR_2010_72]